MKIDYIKCQANAILIVCMRFVPKNAIVNAVDVTKRSNLNTLIIAVRARSPHDVCNIWVLKSIPNVCFI